MSITFHQGAYDVFFNHWMFGVRNATLKAAIPD